MNEITCEKFLMAKMAELDGETTGFSAEEKALHLAACESCRLEMAQMQTVDALLNKQTRREHEALLWTAIEERIAAEPAGKTNWQPFLILGLMLIAYKLLEMLPETDFGIAFKIVPVVLLAALFAVLKENPFKINTELILEK